MQLTLCDLDQAPQTSGAPVSLSFKSGVRLGEPRGPFQHRRSVNQCDTLIQDCVRTSSPSPAEGPLLRYSFFPLEHLVMFSALIPEEGREPWWEGPVLPLGPQPILQGLQGLDPALPPLPRVSRSPVDSLPTH